LQVFNPNDRAPNLAVVAGSESLKQARYSSGSLERGKLGMEMVWMERSSGRREECDRWEAHGVG